MRTSRHSLLATLCLSAGFSTLLAAQEAGFTSLFNGRDLTGWDGNPKLWSVQDGVITGRTTAADPIKVNTFLIYKDATFDDFELRFSYRLVGGNSGVQYRSKVIDPAQWRVGGYQADFEAGKTFSGILYDEGGVAGGRQIMAARGEKVVWTKDCQKQVVGSLGNSDEIQAKIKSEDWNDYVVIARGNHLVHQINSVTTVEVTDDCESKRLRSGVLAFQLHVGPPMTLQLKNVRIKRLTDGQTKSDLDQLQGEWRPVALIANGEEVPPDALAGARLRIKGNAYELRTDQGGSGGTFKLKEGASPKWMDVTADDGSELPAIYEVLPDGFRVCYAINGAPRPTAFKSSSGSDHVLVTYRRPTE
jgi:uncharacterized protein (TIGR03067 family)